MRRVLLGQLGANGDCLYATTIARQLKHDDPSAHLTWAVAERFRGMVDGNPDVDEIWVVGDADRREWSLLWREFRQALERRRGAYDRVILSQIWPDNFQRYDGTIRPSCLRSYGAPITVPVQPVLALSEAEEERAAAFVDGSGLARWRHRILFECASSSGQSHVTPAFALAVARAVTARVPDAAFVLSSATPIETGSERIVDGSSVRLREVAALARACTLFTGCGSGSTVIAASTAGRRLPMVQILRGGMSAYASFAHDYAHWGLGDHDVIELFDADEGRVADCLVEALERSHADARRAFHEPVPIEFSFYRQQIDKMLLRRGRYLDAARSLGVTVERYGWRRELIAFGRERVAPYLRERATRGVEREETERFLEGLWSASPVDPRELQSASAASL